jgi:hypothetical protein
MWRRVSKEVPAGASAERAMAGGSALGGSATTDGGKRHTRREQRKRRIKAGDGLGDHGVAGGVPLLLSLKNSSPTALDAARPLRIIGRSGKIDRANIELHCALIVSVIGQEGSGRATEVRDGATLLIGCRRCWASMLWSQRSLARTGIGFHVRWCSL